MSRYFLLCGCLFLIFICIFLATSFVFPFSKKQNVDTQKNSPQTSLFFQPDTLYLACNNSLSTVSIYIATHQNSVSNAQIELQYDPFIFHNVDITPAPNNFFGENYSVSLQEVRPQYGRATLALSENARNKERKGTGIVATLSFQAESNAASQTAVITFLNKSTVTNNAFEGSLLKSTQPLTIICNK